MRPIGKTLIVAMVVIAIKMAVTGIGAAAAEPFLDSRLGTYPIQEHKKWARTVKELDWKAINADPIWQRDIVTGLKNKPLIFQLQEINQRINAIPYVLDEKDVWLLPDRFLQDGGDCEDYAIAKYLALRELGVPANIMRILLVKNAGTGTGHAVLAVNINKGKTLVLDNRYANLVTPTKKYYSGFWAAMNEDVLEIALPTGKGLDRSSDGHLNVQFMNMPR